MPSFPKTYPQVGEHFPTFGLGCPANPRPDVEDKRHAFRQGFCRAPDCGILFFVCPSCERGQAYCSDECRKRARRLQLREANRRHQQSEEGRLDHRDRQRAYRLRLASLRVTDHGYAPPTACAVMPQPASVALKRGALRFSSALGQHAQSFTGSASKGAVCRFCGRRGRFINPFRERK